MNDDLLDDVSEVKDKPTLLFSKISLAAAVLTLLTFLILLVLIPRTLTATQSNLQEVFFLLSVLIFIFVIAGVVASIVGLLRKEPSHWINWVGSIANLLFLLIIVASIIFGAA